MSELQIFLALNHYNHLGSSKKQPKHRRYLLISDGGFQPNQNAFSIWLQYANKITEYSRSFIWYSNAKNLQRQDESDDGHQKRGHFLAIEDQGDGLLESLDFGFHVAIFQVFLQFELRRRLRVGRQLDRCVTSWLAGNHFLRLFLDLFNKSSNHMKPFYLKSI